MPVRYRPVADGSLSGGPVTLSLYTVPADRTLVLKRFRMYCSTGVAGAVQMLLRPTAASGDTVVGTVTGPVAGNVYAFEVDDLVLSESGVVKLFIPASFVGRYVLSGSLLSGDPA